MALVLYVFMSLVISPKFTNDCTNEFNINSYFIIIGPTALGGPWPPQAIVARDLYSVQPPAKFYNPVSLLLHLPRQSFLISVGHVFVDVKGFVRNIFIGNSFSSIPITIHIL
jgi:hypothetical protein